MKRRKAREYALQFLYSTDFAENSGQLPTQEKGLSQQLETFWQTAGNVGPEGRSFTEDIIKGTLKNLEEIDSVIQKVAENWKLARIASVDRNILRTAVYELFFRSDIPEAVTINEALEIAKKYSAAESAAFINGILDKIAKEHRHKKS